MISDGGGEFVNIEMISWYKNLGIEFLPNPTHGSHLNLCERANQAIIHMMKAMMYAARLPKSFWMHALEMATYLRYRAYCRSI